MSANINVPPFRCFMRAEFAHNLEGGHGSHIPVYVIAATSVRARALGFTVLSPQGAMWARIPLHALCTKPEAPGTPLPALQLWDCFALDMEVIQLSFLKDARGNLRCGDGQWRKGSYLFTFDWTSGDRDRDLSLAEVPDEHKTAHLFRLDEGNFAALPNNRVIWHEGSWVTDPFTADDFSDPERRPKYKVNTHVWTVEGDWRSENSDAYFYSVSTDSAVLED